MINRKELAICKKRGHQTHLLGGGWGQCKWCGIWLREVTTIEEREDAPPESDRNFFSMTPEEKEKIPGKGKRK